jgi:hypothetical protein
MNALLPNLLIKFIIYDKFGSKALKPFKTQKKTFFIFPNDKGVFFKALTPLKNKRIFQEKFLS